jgi:hypothetical protein
MPRLTERIAKLEAATGERQMFYAWREIGQTVEQAEARFRGQHPEAAGHPVTVIGWAE